MLIQPPRQLLPREIELIRELYRKKTNQQDVSAYVTTTTDLVLSNWNGIHPVDDNLTNVNVPAGSTLKIVMVSRFGDCGLTDNFDDLYVYKLRLAWQDPAMTDIRLTREPSPVDLGSDSVGTPGDGMG